MKHIHLDEKTWAKIRAEWEAVGNARLLSKKYGVSEAAIRARRSREKWEKPRSRRDKIVEKAIEKAEEDLIDESADTFKKDNARHCENLEYIQRNIMRGIGLAAIRIAIKKRISEILFDKGLSMSEVERERAVLKRLLDSVPDPRDEVATIRIAMTNFVSLVRTERDIKGHTNRVEDNNEFETLHRILEQGRKEYMEIQERRLALEAEKAKMGTDKVSHLEIVEKSENV